MIDSYAVVKPLDRMKAEWDARAREASRFYIASALGFTEEEFRRSGEEHAALLLESVAHCLPGRERTLEIGCGTGRLLEPMAHHFPEVIGVDVSGEMVRQGRERVRHLPRIRLEEVDGHGSLPFPDQHFDLCYSMLVFIHLPEKKVARHYIQESFRVLKPGGIFRFQVFAVPETLWHSVREFFTKKSTWRGCKYKPSEMDAYLKAAGFEKLDSSLVLDQGPIKKNWILWLTARRPA